MQTLLKLYQDTARIEPLLHGGRKKLGAKFSQLIREVDLSNRVFVNKSGVSLAMNRLSSRALKRKKVQLLRPEKSGKILI